MQFINPTLLWGLAAVLIPIAIHLFNFRKYRKVYFSNVRFLRELQQKTRKQSQLLHLLVLLLRILAISFLVIAFSQPFIPSGKKIIPGQISVVSIFIDNSFSMEAAGKRGRLLDEARIAAAEIAKAYQADDLFQLLSNDFEGRHQRLVTREEFLEMLSEIKLSPAVRSLAEITSRQLDLMSSSRSPSKSAYIISDFQKSTVMSRTPMTSEAVSFYLVPIETGNTGNLYIDSCWFDQPMIKLDQTVNLNVSIRNTAATDLEKIPVKLMINGRQRAVSAISVAAGGNTQVSLPFNNTESGIMQGQVEISDYPVTYDDIYFLTYRVSDNIPLLAINSREDNPYLRSVFGLDSVIKYTSIPARQTDYSSFSGYRLIILNDLQQISSGAVQELTKYTRQGGNLMVFPAFDADLNSVNQLLSALGADQLLGLDSAVSKVSSVNNRHPVFKDVFEKTGLNEENVDYPVIREHFRLSAISKGRSETLLSLSNGDALMIAESSGEGRVYLSAVPITDQAGNWPRHALFVPAMLNIAFRSENTMPLMYYPASSTGINLGNAKPAEDNVFKVTGNDGAYEFIPEYRRIDGQSVIFINEQIKEAGIYNVNSGKQMVTMLAFNYNRNESDLSVADDAALDTFTGKTEGFSIINPGIKPINEIIAENTRGKSLWRWFIIAALLCIAGEVLLLRFFGKNKTV